jgi:hypothetical protein
MYQLLGGYAERMAVPANAVRPMARHSDIVFPDLVIHSAVHARFFSGSAHLPTMIPKSLSGPIPVPVDTP